MTALNPSPAAADLPGSQLATGAYPGARRLSTSPARVTPPRAANALAGACMGEAAGSFQIVVNLLPHGNTAPEMTSSPSREHPFRSLKRQTLNQTGSQCSERNKTIPVRVGDDADLRAGRAHLSRKRPVLRFFLPSLVGLSRASLGHPYLSASLTPSACQLCVSQTHSDTDGARSDGELNRNHESFDRKSGD